jgi:hypothetical protein
MLEFKMAGIKLFPKKYSTIKRDWLLIQKMVHNRTYIEFKKYFSTTHKIRCLSVIQEISSKQFTQ